MRKNKTGKKERIARAKRGNKNFLRERKSKGEKALRLARKLQQRVNRRRKLEELISKLSGESSILQKEKDGYMNSAEEKGSN